MKGASQGKVYYVDANLATTGDGLSWEASLPTMAAAFAKIASGDTIIFRGKIKEQLTTPVQVFDVTIIGAGNRPRHADSTPDGGADAMASWAAPDAPDNDLALVKVLQQGWRFENILFYSGASAAPCISLFRNNGADDAERDASHASIIGCRFASGFDGIWVVEVANTYIKDCIFNGFTGTAILGVAGSGIANPLRGHIINCEFQGNANHVYVAMNQWVIRGNIFDDGGTPTTTIVLNTAGPSANGASCFVVDNYFQTATANFNSPDVVGNATDVWNNVSIDGTTSMIGREVGQPA
jgi:hypothetical protein